MIYSYDLKINADAALLQKGSFASAFPNCKEVLITSKNFSTFKECETALGNLLSTLSVYERKLSDNNLVIVTKWNPLHLEQATKPAENEMWEDFTVLKAYVADSALLKKSELKFDVFAQIRTAPYPSSNIIQ